MRELAGGVREDRKANFNLQLQIFQYVNRVVCKRQRPR